jgi:TRAP-type mannitol/chloroaromatic compound transport system permease small subunit
MTEETQGASPASDAPQDLLDRVLTVMNTIGSLWIFVLMVMIDTDAFSRTLFNHPIHGVNELVEMSIIAIVFMQLGDATRKGRLTRSDGFYGMIQRRNARAGHVMGAIFDFLGVVFLLIVLYGVVPELHDAWRFDYFVGEEGLFTVPEWPIKFILVLGCTVTMLQFVKFTIRHLVPAVRGVR